jgi:hypothetical protein
MKKSVSKNNQHHYDNLLTDTTFFTLEDVNLRVFFYALTATATVAKLADSNLAT